MDADLGKELKRNLKKELGIDSYLNHKVTGASVKGNMVTVTAKDKMIKTLNCKQNIVWCSR